MHLSVGNRKMPKGKGFLIWNLPAGATCPGSTAECRRICYARKAECVYKTPLPSREANLCAARRPDFAERMIALLTKTIARSRTFAGYFRIHESGDFFNQAYLDAWIEIARAFPNAHFLAFTKSFELDFAHRPANFQVVASVMPDTTLPVPAGMPIAYAGDCTDMRPYTPCSGHCDHCKLCWNLPHDSAVHFKYH